ncbi:MAG: DpnD/PcfM family protein [Paludibacter sp.]
MQNYKIEITEILRREVEIEAENIDSAIQIINEKYKSEEIVLDSSDFVEYKIEEYIP